MFIDDELVEAIGYVILMAIEGLIDTATCTMVLKEEKKEKERE